MLEKLIEITPKLNYDQLVDLTLYVALEAKINDRGVWRALEQSALDNLHLFSLKQLCQLQWASAQLKPKQMSARTSTLLTKQALEQIGTCSALDLCYIMQGFRQKSSKDDYYRVREAMVKRKSQLFPKGVQTEEDRNMMINLLFTFASCRPKHHKFGQMKLYEEQDLDELVAIYEDDLCEAGEEADAEHLTRLAQAMYILKTGGYENIFWRIERRANELASQDKLDIYHVTNILRAFSRSQNNRMCAKDKTFYNLEKAVLRNLDSATDRELSHLMYAYGIRAVGNPELHAKFEQKLAQIAGRLDYPSMFNVIYYMLFRGIKDQAIWQQIVDNTVEQEAVLPLTYLRPFKISEQYLKKTFPEMDLSDYRDKFWHAGFYFDQHKKEDEVFHESEYMNFKAFLTGHCLVYPELFVTQNGLFTLHFVFSEFKIAINYHLIKFTKPEDSMPSEMQKLASKILKHDDWEIYDLSEKEFKTWDYEDRVNNIRGWLKAAKER